jgi:hypothetical protein
MSVDTSKRMPLEWASLLFHLADAYRALETGDRENNLETAISLYRSTWNIYTPESYPFEWAASQNNCGNAYQELTRGSRRANMEAAAACYENALRIFIALQMEEHVQGIRSNLAKVQQALQSLH